MTYLTQAHNRLLARLAAEAPAEISVVPRASEFEAQAAQIKAWSGLWAEFLHAVATDGASNTNTITKEVTGYVSDAMSEFAGQFTEAAEALREDETAPRSDFDEHNIRHSAYSGAA